MSFFTELLDGLRAIFTWYFAVSPWERAIRVKWGKHDELLGPGLHLRVPIRDRIYRHSIRLRSTESLGQNLTTADHHILTIAFVIEWSIEDLLKIFTTITQPERTLITRVKALVADYVASNDLADIKPLRLGQEVTTKIPCSSWGLGDVKVSVTEFISTARTYRLIQGGHSFAELDHNVRWDVDLLGKE